MSSHWRGRREEIGIFPHQIVCLRSQQEQELRGTDVCFNFASSLLLLGIYNNCIVYASMYCKLMEAWLVP
jgi:hypothetical protein